MMELLAGVPGKLKTLLGRFTATRAAAEQLEFDV